MAVTVFRREARTARARTDALAAVARQVAPVTLAGDRRLSVPERCAELVGGPLPRGSVVTVRGAPGLGATSIGLAIAAAATAAGEWAAVVDPDASIGGLAAVEAGVELARCGIVRRVPADRWPTVVGALLDGVLVVVAAVPPRLSLGDARRLQARARERQSVLVALESVPGTRTGAWPADATRRIAVDAVEWRGLERGSGLLGARVVSAHVAGKGAPPRTAKVVA